MLIWFLGCIGSSGPPPSTHGRVLHVGAETLLVQHDDLRGRVVAGVERYRLGSHVAAKPGEEVQLWLEADQVLQLKVTGSGALPEDFQVGGAPLVGTVVNVDGIRVVVDHDEVPGVMGPMVMGFGVAPWEVAALASGDRISGRVVRSDYGLQLVDVEKIGHQETHLRTDIKPLLVGEQLPRFELTAEDGSTIILGKGQGVPTAFTYIYTRCPDPNFCPAIAARMAALQGRLHRARIITLSIDPDNDTPKVLAAWSKLMGADPTVWRAARAEPVVLQELALRGGQHVSMDKGKISHLHRLLILDSQGRLIERYDDNAWPMDRIVSQLTTVR